MTEDEKKWIDEADYATLLSRWRFAPVGDPMFIDETGKYFSTVMCRKRDALGFDAVRISKQIGWNNEE